MRYIHREGEIERERDRQWKTQRKMERDMESGRRRQKKKKRGGERVCAEILCNGGVGYCLSIHCINTQLRAQGPKKRRGSMGTGGQSKDVDEPQTELGSNQDDDDPLQLVAFLVVKHLQEELRVVLDHCVAPHPTPQTKHRRMVSGA